MELLVDDIASEELDDAWFLTIGGLDESPKIGKLACLGSFHPKRCLI